MKRYLLTISYEGTNYCGWQRQLRGISVQQKVEEALATSLQAPIVLKAASRTDKGVHALCQCAQFDAETTIPAHKFPLVFNPLLPKDIRVVKGQEVSMEFSARYMPVQKTYTYRIHNASYASAMFRNVTAHIPVKMDVSIMHEAAQCLVGTHDFGAFCSIRSNAKSTIRRIDTISVTRDGNYVIIKVQGKSFLYNMVRIIAGALIEIGQGKRKKECLQIALQTKNRLVLGVTAPAEGLELTKIFYGDYLPEETDQRG